MGMQQIDKRNPPWCEKNNFQYLLQHWSHLILIHLIWIEWHSLIIMIKEQNLNMAFTSISNFLILCFVSTFSKLTFPPRPPRLEHFPASSAPQAPSSSSSPPWSSSWARPGPRCPLSYRWSAPSWLNLHTNEPHLTLSPVKGLTVK